MSLLDPEQICETMAGRPLTELAPAHVVEGARVLRADLDRGRWDVVGRRLVHLELRRIVGAWVASVLPAAPAAPPRPAPVVIVGLPRSGTTILHHLFALDPAMAAPTLNDATWPHTGSGADDGASMLDAHLRLLDARSPDVQFLHPMAPDQPEECSAALQLWFTSERFSMMFDAPGYRTWLAGADVAPVYRAHLGLVERVTRGTGDRPRRLVLKSPTHLAHLDALLDTFGPVHLVVLRRQAGDALASFGDLVHATRQVFTPEVDPEAIWDEWTPFWASALARATTAIGARHHLVRSCTTYDFNEIRADPVAVVADYYRRQQWDLTPRARDQMTERAAATSSSALRPLRPVSAKSRDRRDEAASLLAVADPEHRWHLDR